VHLGPTSRPSAKGYRAARARVGSPAVETNASSDVGEGFFRAAVNGLTPYQPGKPVEDVQRELGLDHVIKLASNEGPFGPFAAAQEAMARAAPELNRYPDGGALRLHAAIAERHGLSPQAICVGSGADGCIDMLSQAILDPGDEVVCGWPSFPSYVIYARKQGATPVTVPLVEHQYDLSALLEAITPRTKLVYICHPNNPTGTMNTTDELDAYFERVPEHVLTVIDQAYFEYIDRPDYPDAVERYLKAGRRVVVLRTFSKIYGLAGLRVGYAVGPHAVCAALAKVRRPFDLTTTAQVAALASVAEVDEIARRRGLNAEGLAQLEAAVRAHGLDPVPSVGNFVYVETGSDANTLFERLLHEGVIVRPLAGFGSTTAIRVSVGTAAEIDAFAAALGRLLAPA
jgi:histidinol-phosphate aminotransferase